MKNDTPTSDITKKPVVLSLPGMDAAVVRRDVTYADGATLDVYRPPDAPHTAPLPVVVFVSGYSDAGFQRMLGCKLKDMASYVSWAKLVAVSGMAAVTYSTGADPVADVRAVLRVIRENAASLGIDPDRIGLWACSGNAPTGLSLLTSNEGVARAVFCYGYMLDLDGATHVSDASGTFRFANPTAGKSVDDLARDVPILVVRAGRDEMPGLNAGLDRFLEAAVRRNLPLSFINHPEGGHAFDISDDTDATRDVIRRILEFLAAHLTD